MRRFVVAAILAPLLLSAGCVTETIAPEDVAVSSSRLVVTRSGSTVSLSWESEKDATYTVVYADRRNAAGGWQPLPGASSLRGTGASMSARDEVPAGRNRYYRLQMTRSGPAR